MKITKLTVLAACGVGGGVLMATAAIASLLGSPAAEAHPKTSPPSGVVFQCTAQQLLQIKPAVDSYLQQEGVDLHLVSTTLNIASSTLAYSLVAPLADANSLDLIDRPALNLTEELIELPAAKGEKRTVLTVSKKEILYAMLQTGQATVFDGQACDAQALIDQIGIRQNTVAWAETLSWQWPEGGPALWNKKYWHRGDPVKGYPLQIGRAHV